MKARIIIAAVLALITFCGIAYGYLHIAFYCDQSFDDRSVPALCATASQASMLLEITYSVASWVIAFGLPALVALLYLRFGWPRGK